MMDDEHTPVGDENGDAESGFEHFLERLMVEVRFLLSWIPLAAHMPWGAVRVVAGPWEGTMGYYDDDEPITDGEPGWVEALNEYPWILDTLKDGDEDDPFGEGVLHRVMAVVYLGKPCLSPSILVPHELLEMVDDHEVVRDHPELARYLGMVEG